MKKIIVALSLFLSACEENCDQMIIVQKEESQQ